MEDILQSFKATGSLRRSMATVSMSLIKPSSKVLLTSSSLNTLKDRSELSAITGKSKGDRVAEILSRVKSLTKKLDGKSKNSNDPNSNQNAFSTAGGVSDSTDLSLMMKGRNKMEIKNMGKIDDKNDNDNVNENENENEKLDSTWSLSNPMHLDRVEKRGGAEGGKGGGRENNNLSKIEEEDDRMDMNENKDRGKDRRMKPHRYGQIEEGEEEEEEVNLISHHEETDHHGIDDVTDIYDNDNDSEERTKEYSESDRLLLNKR